MRWWIRIYPIISAIIGHLKHDGCQGHNSLKGTGGDSIDCAAELCRTQFPSDPETFEGLSCPYYLSLVFSRKTGAKLVFYNVERNIKLFTFPMMHLDLTFINSKIDRKSICLVRIDCGGFGVEALMVAVLRLCIGRVRRRNSAKLGSLNKLPVTPTKNVIGVVRLRAMFIEKEDSTQRKSPRQTGTNQDNLVSHKRQHGQEG